MNSRLQSSGQSITTTKTVVTSTAKARIKDETSFTTASGAASLVAKSQFQLQNIGSLIPEDEVDTQIAIACLVNLPNWSGKKPN